MGAAGFVGACNLGSDDDAGYEFDQEDCDGGGAAGSAVGFVCRGICFGDDCSSGAAGVCAAGVSGGWIFVDSGVLGLGAGGVLLGSGDVGAAAAGGISVDSGVLGLGWRRVCLP